MSLTLNFGSSAIDLTSGSDLVNFLEANVPAELRFLTDPAAFAGKKLADIGNNQASLTFVPSQALNWELGTAGNVTFGLSASAKGSVTIQTSGALYEYSLADSDKPVTVTVPAGSAYVSIALEVSLGVQSGAAFSSGSVGVKGHFNGDVTFDLAFRKAFPAATDVLTAIGQTFEAFTLPFQPAGVSKLGVGDILDYEYFGRIDAGFGVTYGVSGSLIAGRSGDEISESFNLSPLGRAIVNIKPTFQAGASFALGYQHQAMFHVIVARQAASAGMIYSLSNKSDISATETVGITLNAGAGFNLTSNVPDAATRLADSAFAGLTGQLGSSAAAGLAHRLISDGTGQFQAYINDVNSSVNQILSKGDGLKIQLQLIQEKAKSGTALFHYEFDLSQPDALGKGYALAIRGDLAGAIEVAGVSLDPGSFVENTWTRKSSASFQFFDLFKANDATSYYANTKLIYAGNKTFRFVFRTGVKEVAAGKSATNSCEVYFTANGPASQHAVKADDLEVLLNFALTDHSSAPVQETKRALAFIGGQALRGAIAQIPDEPSGSVTVTCRFTSAAFGRVDCDEYAGDKPPRLPHAKDAANYTTFVAATDGIVRRDNVEDDFLRFFKSYDSWMEFNRVKVDQEGSTMTPDRRQTGNPAVSVWPVDLILIPNDIRTLLQCYVDAAQSFMNLCDSLKHLAAQLSSGDFNSNYTRLTDALNRIVRQNIAVFFIKSAMAALFRAAGCSSSGVEVSRAGKDIAVIFTAAVTNT